MKRPWMQSALGRKPGALRRQLVIPRGHVIPKSLLTRIVNADPGDVVINPTTVGKHRYTVTRLMKQRSNPVLTAGRVRGNKHRRGRVIY